MAKNDDVISAVRVAMMMLRYARPTPSPLLKRRPSKYSRPIVGAPL